MNDNPKTTSVRQSDVRQSDVPHTEMALPYTYPIQTSDLLSARANTYDLRPTQAECDAIAQDLGILALRKFRFEASIEPLGKHDWQLNAKLGATVVQECVITLEPVSTRIDDKVERQWLRQTQQHISEKAGAKKDPKGGSKSLINPGKQEHEEVEMIEDHRVDLLKDEIDLGQVMCEALAILLPLYPRSEGAEYRAHQHAAPGTVPMSDDDAKPFAGLSALRDQLTKDEPES